MTFLARMHLGRITEAATTFLEPDATRRVYAPADSAVTLTSLKTANPFCSFTLLPPAA